MIRWTNRDSERSVLAAYGAGLWLVLAGCGMVLVGVAQALLWWRPWR